MGITPGQADGIQHMKERDIRLRVFYIIRVGVALQGLECRKAPGSKEGAVTAGLLVVVKTGQEELVKRRAHFALGGFDQREPQRLRIVEHAPQVTRHASVGRADDQGGRRRNHCAS